MGFQNPYILWSYSTSQIRNCATAIFQKQRKLFQEIHHRGETMFLEAVDVIFSLAEVLCARQI